MPSPAGGAALGGAAGAMVGGPAGAVAGAAMGAALAEGSTPGRAGTVHSARVSAARKAGGKRPGLKSPPRTGALAAIRAEIADRLAARGETRLAERRPGTPGTVRATWRSPARVPGQRRVGLVRATPLLNDDPTQELSQADVETAPGRAWSARSAADRPVGSATGWAFNPDTGTHQEQRTSSTAPSAGDPAASSAPATETITAPPRAGRSNLIMPTSRYSISLEPPTTDGEFLEQSRDVSQALSGLADQIEAWVDGLAALNMPPAILADFQDIPEGLQDAAGRARAGAQHFEEHFEDTRHIASRGMRFDGTDSA